MHVIASAQQMRGALRRSVVQNIEKLTIKTLPDYHPHSTSELIELIMLVLVVHTVFAQRTNFKCVFK